MKRKALDPKLPGRYAKMSRAEMDAESNQYDVEFSVVGGAPIANSRPHPKFQKAVRDWVKRQPRKSA